MIKTRETKVTYKPFESINTILSGTEHRTPTPHQVDEGMCRGKESEYWMSEGHKILSIAYCALWLHKVFIITS